MNYIADKLDKTPITMKYTLGRALDNLNNKHQWGHEPTDVLNPVNEILKEYPNKPVVANSDLRMVHSPEQSVTFGEGINQVGGGLSEMLRSKRKKDSIGYTPKLISKTINQTSKDIHEKILASIPEPYRSPSNIRGIDNDVKQHIKNQFIAPALRASLNGSLNTLSGKTPDIVIKNEKIPPASPYTRINNNKSALIEEDGVNES